MEKKEKPISPDMTVLEIVSRFRNTPEVFAEYDEKAGECICCQALFERLDDVAERYGLDLEQLVDDLNLRVNTG